MSAKYYLSSRTKRNALLQSWKVKKKYKLHLREKSGNDEQSQPDDILHKKREKTLNYIAVWEYIILMSYQGDKRTEKIG